MQVTHSQSFENGSQTEYVVNVCVYMCVCLCVDMYCVKALRLSDHRGMDVPIMAAALRSNSSYLREQDLSYNHPVRLFRMNAS